MTEIETAKMSERGQIIIPKEVRDYIGAGESTIFTIMPIDRETVVMKKLDREKLVREFRAIRARTIKISEKEINDEIAAYRREKRR